MDYLLWMVFEAVAPTKDDLEDSLQDHVEMLEEEDGVEIVETQEDDVSEIENPHPGLEEGFSQVTEVRIRTEEYLKAMKIVISYGPTYVQLEEPERIEMDLKEGQETLQEVATLMHQYAQSGAGGVMISRASAEN